MPEPVLRLFDGFSHTSPELRDTVRELQATLRRQQRDVVVDGLYGRGTEEAVRTFQKTRGLPADGIVGLETWRLLNDAMAWPAHEQFATSYALDHDVLLADLVAAARYGALIETAAAASGFLPAVIAALGSRESRWGLTLKPLGPAGTADFVPRPYGMGHRCGPLPPDGAGFGRGLLRLDYDVHEFARTGDWQDPAANLRFGCQVLGEARALLRRRTVLHGAALLRGTLAAYNCGVENVLRAVRQGVDLDFFTAGRDYGRDVLSRAGFFQAHGWD